MTEIPSTTASWHDDQLEDENGRRKSLVNNILKRKSVAEELATEFELWKLEHFGQVNIAAPRQSYEEFRSTLHHVVCLLVRSSMFDAFIMFTILLNAITIAAETSYINEDTSDGLFKGLDTAYITIYTMEFLLKVYADPIDYWKSSYNRFDVIILLTSYFSAIQDALGDEALADVTFLRVFRALRALRALRSISFVRALQVIVNALIKTIASIVNLITLLLLIMYVFAMVGHYYFGRGVDADVERWGDLGSAMYTLWVFTTLDSWISLQQELDVRGFTIARVYTILFIFVGNFIFTNLFIGVVIQNLEEAQEEERTIQQVKKSKLFHRKKAFILEKQRIDLEQLVCGKRMRGDEGSFDDFLKLLVGELRHDDMTRVEYLTCSQLWFDTYLATLHVQEVSTAKIQRLHFEIATLLGQAVEQRLLCSIDHKQIN